MCCQSAHVLHLPQQPPGPCKAFSLCLQEDELDRRARVDTANMLLRPPPSDAIAYAQQQAEHKKIWLKTLHQEK